MILFVRSRKKNVKKRFICDCFKISYAILLAVINKMYRFRENTAHTSRKFWENLKEMLVKF